MALSIKAFKTNRLILKVQRLFFWTVLGLWCTQAAAFGAGAENIRLNQIGFYQYGPKKAIIISAQAWRFTVKSPDLSVTYYTGDVQPASKWAASNELAAVADFSNFTRIGSYVIDVSGVGTSYTFKIDSTIHRELTRGLLRAFYYQRASTDLPAQYAGKWARGLGHPDTKVIIHASAASDAGLPGGRKTGDEISSPKGWYDAGDYGKYTVNAGISVYTLLSLYERFPGYCDSISLDIPQTYPGMPDILSEVKWELDWLLTMQDPSDGGVYHKLTSLDFCGFIMPGSDLSSRYVIGKASAATFDFTALCAMAYRIYKKYTPGFADSCLSAAKYAWKWGSAHPNVTFRNPSDVKTGEYGDGNIQDERQWAAVELYLSTGDSLYRAQAFKSALTSGVPSWPNVSTLGTYSLSGAAADSARTANALFAAQADVLGTFVDGSPYYTVMYDQFYWGSNGLAANDGMMFIEAFLATKKPVYFERAVQTLDYLLGRNAMGYSFVTGFGSLSPRHPHHRPSSADGIDDPEPGFLVGGPNVQQNDAADCNVAYPPGKLPAKSWIDAECSYASNEVAINWNAPAAFLAGAIEAIYADTANHVQTYKHDTLPPATGDISVQDIAADRATIAWKTNRDVSGSVLLGVDSQNVNGLPVFSADSRVHKVTLMGLQPQTRYFFSVNCVDAFGASVQSQTRSFVTNSSPLAEGLSIHVSEGSVMPGVALPISFSAKKQAMARVDFATCGSSSIKSVACQEDNGTYSAVIPGSRISPAGIYLTITVSDSGDSITSRRYWLVPSKPIDCQFTPAYPKAYQLISLPLRLPPMLAQQFFTSQFGDKSQWRYLSYNSDSGTYSSADSVRTGGGGWLYSVQKKTIGVNGIPVNPDSLYSLPLTRGWNLISSPFIFPVYWENSLVRYLGVIGRISDVYSGQLVKRQIFSYLDTTSDQLNNGQYYSNINLLSRLDTTRLNPWQSYWVYAEKNGVELLLNPNSDPPQKPLTKSRVREASGWQLRLSASANGNVDNNAIVGAAAEASDGYDELDCPKPPLVSNDIRVGLVRPMWKQHGALFASDIVSTASGGNHQWFVAVIARSGGAAVDLTWKMSGNSGGYLYLYDSVAGARIDLLSAEGYRMNFVSGETQRDLIIRSMPRADNSMRTLPTVWALGQAAPNPFKIATAITYCVAAQGQGYAAPRHLTLAVYDMLGRRVKSLVDGKALPGRYTIVWNGADDIGRPLRKGVYIIHLLAEGYSASLKTQIVD